MFVLGECGDPLCLFLDTDNNHGAHFLPARVEANGLITSFLKNAVASSVGNLPFAAANGQELFSVSSTGPHRYGSVGGPDLRRALSHPGGRKFLHWRDRLRPESGRRTWSPHG